MGQSHSRGNFTSRRLSRHVDGHTPETPGRVQPEAVADVHSSPNSQETPEPSGSVENKRARRRSWLGLGGQKSSTEGADGSATSTTRRRWRRSSKVPVQVSDVSESVAETATGPETSSAYGSAVEAPAPAMGNGKADGSQADVVEEGASASSSAVPPPCEPIVIASSPSLEPALHEIHPPIDEVPESRADETPVGHFEPLSEHPSDSAQDNVGDNQQPSEPRHFPPAGTLVVVQGVVHTTDVPRRSIDSQQPPRSASPGTLPPYAPSTPASPTTSLPPTTRRSLSMSRSSTPTPRSESSGRRNRLSALISGSRRSSLLGPRRESADTASGIIPSRSSVDTESAHALTSNTTEESSSHFEAPSAPAATMNTEPLEEGEEHAEPAETPSAVLPPHSPTPAVDQATSPPNRGRSTLSPGSIEVLGTLLSVAAAATAASLVSGSSDPLSSFRTGFGNGTIPAPSSTPANPFMLPPSPSSPPPTGPERPTSPTPTAGLGLGGLGLGGLSSLASGRSEEVENDRGRRSRARNSWGGLRERLGLTQAPTSPSAVPTGSASSTPRPSLSSPPLTPASPSNAGFDTGGSAGAGDAGGQGAALDPRERMLREMARALSQGLGIADRNADSNASTASPASNAAGVDTLPLPAPTAPNVSSQPAGPPAPPPPEGSFERFLVDLQADLRTALSENHDDNSESDEAASAARASVAAPRTGSDQPRTSVDSAVDELGDVLPTSLRSSDSEESDGDMPSLRSVSDSSSEDESEEEEEYEEPAGPERPHENIAEGIFSRAVAESRPSPPPAETTSHFPPHRRVEGHTTRRPGGGINWWRLYRFPPMPSPSTQAQATGTAGSANTYPTRGSDAPGVSTVPTVSEHVEQPNAAVPSSSVFEDTPRAGSETAVPPPEPTANVNMIVPVIVVGLQSVNADGTSQTQQHADPAPPRPDTPTVADGMDDGVPDTPTANPRRQSWRNALSRFRPTRRNSVNTPNAAQNSGSRTFLIYVIGGYYPPNHHMVTGSDNLDSFEALLELAELLGQVKPPTATREEIEKSGLQIIKPCDLEKYEKEGRVASNCVDRCLICLDDYFAEDDLRVMSCKHAFHKNCVDKWLETGRNNCPACRSKGVSTSDDLQNQPSTPVTPASPRVI